MLFLALALPAMYAYVPPINALSTDAQRGSAKLPWAAVTIVTSVDATGLVPDLSPGAGQGCGDG